MLWIATTKLNQTECTAQSRTSELGGFPFKGTLHQEMREFERRAHVPDHFLDHASVGSMTELFSVLDAWLMI